MKYVYAFLALTGIWYLLYFSMDSAIIPSPLTVYHHFLVILYTKLLLHIGYSLFRVLTALLTALLLGVSVGILCGSSEKLDGLLSPVIYLLSPIPKAAFLPVLMVFFGLGELPKILLIVIVVIFHFIIAARDAMKNIPSELRLYERSLRLGKADRLLHFTIPAILPSVFTALRINAGIAAAVLFFSENFSARYGIGYFIMNNWVMGNYVDMYCGILAISVMGLLIYGGIGLLERRMVKWKG